MALELNEFVHGKLELGATFDREYDGHLSISLYDSVQGSLRLEFTPEEIREIKDFLAEEFPHL